MAVGTVTDIFLSVFLTRAPGLCPPEPNASAGTILKIVPADFRDEVCCGGRLFFDFYKLAALNRQRQVVATVIDLYRQFQRIVSHGNDRQHFLPP